MGRPMIKDIVVLFIGELFFCPESLPVLPSMGACCFHSWNITT